MNTLRKTHDIFDLIGSSHNAYHSAVLTCFTFDPIFFNTYFLPNLRRCGITNIIVLVDSKCYDEIMQQHVYFAEELKNLHYSIVRQNSSSNGAFHPKVSLLSGDDRAMMFVGSGNLTYSGYALNQEIWSVFSLRGEDSIYAPIIIKGWKYLSNLCSNKSFLIDQQLKWLEEYSQWMHKADETSDIVEVDDGTSFSFLYNNEKSLFNQIVERLQPYRISSIKVVAPYYDVSGGLIKSLKDVFNPEIIHCVIDKRGIYPYEFLGKKNNYVKFYDWSKVSVETSSSTHLHGKLFQFETDGGTFLLLGSANATNRAFGLISGCYNDEACVLIHSSHRLDYLADLDIKLDSPMTLEETKSLNKPSSENKTNTQNFEVHIESAEYIGSSLTIKLGGDCKGNVVAVECPGNKDVERYTIKKDCGKCIKMPISRITLGTSVYIEKDNERVSNRVVVILDDVVTKCNPNKRLRNIQSVLNDNHVWQNNLEELVSFMYFEEDFSRTTTIKHSTSSKDKKETLKSISSDEFDQIEFKQKQQLLNNPNVLVAEFLLSSVTTLRQVHDSDDDIDNYEDVSSGETKVSSLKESTNKDLDDSKFVRSVFRYVNKIINSRFSIQLDSFNKGCKDGLLGEITPMGYTINDFSYCAIALILINDILQNKRSALDQNSLRKLRDLTTTLVGKFSLLHRDSLTREDSYIQYKMHDFANAILLYTLNIISSYPWVGDDKKIETLVVLNLLDLFRNSAVFGVALLKHLQSKHSKNTSIDIHRISKQYALFFEVYAHFISFNTSAHIREFGRFFQSGFMYKQKYGFLHINALHLANGEGRLFDTYHPGFGEIKKLVCGNKYVALHI